MKSTIKLTLTSLLLFFSFSTVQAAVVETDTVMSQNYVETNRIKASSINTSKLIAIMEISSLLAFTIKSR